MIMNLAIVACGSASERDSEALRLHPEFRKATMKMRLVCGALDSALSLLPKFVMGEEMGLVLNSGFGELDATMEFLRTFAETGIARPLPFQNSLHNSTSGFVSIRYGIRGPVSTVNHRLFGGEQAIQAAATLIADRQCYSCVVVSVESASPALADENSGVVGASALILAERNWATEKSLPVLTLLKELRCVSAPPNASGRPFESLLEFDAIHQIACALRKKGSLTGEQRIEKPGSCTSVASWA